MIRKKKTSLYYQFRAPKCYLAALEALSEKFGTQKSETIRFCLREAAERRGLWPDSVDTETQ